jgi:hypothetical protein
MPDGSPTGASLLDGQMTARSRSHSAPTARDHRVIAVDAMAVRAVARTVRALVGLSIIGRHRARLGCSSTAVIREGAQPMSGALRAVLNAEIPALRLQIAEIERTNAAPLSARRAVASAVTGHPPASGWCPASRTLCSVQKWRLSAW